MPLFQYFGWVGSFLLAALLAANWCVSAPAAPNSDIDLDHKINIRIHTDHKWPEAVVFDTKTPAPIQTADAEVGIGESEPVVSKGQPLEAFAEMRTPPARPCFRPPCSAGATANRDASPVEASKSRNRARVAARKDVTLPNRLHKPPGKS